MPLPEIAPGNRFRLVLPDRNHTTGGAYQVWRGDALVYQGSHYGGLQPDPAPDIWRPVGLVQTNSHGPFIVLFVPSDAEPGEYELRIATTQGSRCGSFVVTAAERTP